MIIKYVVLIQPSFLSTLAQCTLHIVTLADLLHPLPAQRPGQYNSTACFKALQVIEVQLPSLSIARHHL